MLNKEVVLNTLKCSPNQYPQLLDERFPHVLEKVVKLWNSPDAEPYFTDLLQPNGRGGGRFDRDGFPDTAWREILRLQLLHSKQRSH